MLKLYVKAGDLLARLRTDKDGVVSFEYVIVAAAVVAAVIAAFGGLTGTGGIATALSTALGKISTQIGA
jgi:Flp pilus assembly pilin Flp